jgi:hypothetical protein
VNKQIRKLATVAATAALALQLFAGATLAAVPDADFEGQSYDFAGTGWAGFATTLDYTDTSTLAKLYLEIDVSGASSIGYVGASKNSNPVGGCSPSGTVVKCLFKTVRNGDSFTVEVGAVPASATTANVTATGGWSSTGYVVGGNNSHGDSWPLCRVLTDTDCRQAPDAPAEDAFGYPEKVVYLVASRGTDQGGNYSEGFGNKTLSTNQTVDKRTNPQAARLENLPAGVFASVNDQATFDDTTGFWKLEIHVLTDSDLPFDLVILYPKGTSAPTAYEHIADDGTSTTYTACAKGDTTECFEWSNKNSTATLHLPHNGGVRRT